MYALIKNNKVVEYPISINVWRLNNPTISLPVEPTEYQLNEFGIFNVQTAKKPLTKIDEIAEISIEKNGDIWAEVWTIRDATSDEISANMSNLISQYEQALTNHLDTTAQTKKYDNRITCALRAGYSGPFQAEGQAFAQWMDSCNALAYQWLSEIKSGTKPMFNSTSEFIENLPKIVWPS